MSTLPSDQSLRALDGVNFFTAAVLAGFGPFVAVYLGEGGWSQENIGFALSAVGIAGLLSLRMSALSQTQKSSRSANVFRSSPNNGHASAGLVYPFGMEANIVLLRQKRPPAEAASPKKFLKKDPSCCIKCKGLGPSEDGSTPHV